MRKQMPYILVAVVVLVIAILLASTKKRARRMDERMSLSREDKIPYGMFVAHDLLPGLFKNAVSGTEEGSPLEWEIVDTTAGRQLVVLPMFSFDASRDELMQLSSFASHGNHLLLITPRLNSIAEEFFNLEQTGPGMRSRNDSTKVTLEAPVFAPMTFRYPGRVAGSEFKLKDTARQQVLGRNQNGEVNFVRLRYGSGTIYLHSEPTAFTNYFLLHKKNLAYFEQVFSSFPSDLTGVYWSEYYLNEHSSDKKDTNWLGVLLRYEAFRAGLYTALLALLLILLLEFRRRQRPIPVRPPLQNESLDFVETLGRLYYDQKDHLGLATKMGQYFLEHVRNKYKLHTEKLDADFNESLQARSGHDAGEIKQITDFICFTREGRAINELQLKRFYTQLEKFYQNT